MLDELKERMNDCTKCPSLCENRSRVVFGSGSKNPKLMIIGEAPGEQEDAGGLPFVGRSGKQLDRILKYVGVDREECYISNAVLCRPPNNRDPHIEEIKSCRWRLLLQIKLLNPELIILLGRVAVTAMFGEEFKGPLSRFFDNKKWLEFDIDGQTFKGVATYHPSYLLRQPAAKRRVLPHWARVKDYLTNGSA
jgi:DNA polymerase